MKVPPTARRPRWRRSAAAQGVVMALATCLTHAASAEPLAVGETEPSERVKAQARSLFQEGNSLLDAGQYVAALERFEQARSLWDNPKIQLNIATTRRALGMNAAAANAYALYLERAPPDSPNRAEAEQILGTLTLKTGRLVLSNLGGVTKVLLDGVELPVTEGREVWVEAGEHLLTAERLEGSATQHAFSVLAAEVLRVELTRPAERPRTATATPTRRAPDEDRPASEPSTSRLALSARLDLDPKGRGAVAAAGISVHFTDHLRLTGGALMGARKGGWVGVDYLPWRGDVRPFVGVAAPAFYVDSFYAGVAVQCGLGYRLASRVAPFVHAAVVHFPAAPTGYVKTVFVPAAGIEVIL